MSQGQLYGNVWISALSPIFGRDVVSLCDSIPEGSLCTVAPPQKDRSAAGFAYVGGL